MTGKLTRYTIYHARDLMQMILFDTTVWMAQRDLQYRRVAEVDIAPDDGVLERVFWLTNHSDRAWIRNPEVAWFATDAPVRSTSVGDVIVCERTQQAWMVVPYGFELIPADQTKQEPSPD